MRWLAQDADGVWWGYEHEPHMADSSWYENEVGRYAAIGKKTENSNWKHSLRKLDKEDV